MRKPGTFKPGQSGNPHGRPKCALKDAIQAALAETVTVVGEDGKSRKMSENQAIIGVARRLARAGNVKAMELLWERGYGKAMQPMEIDASLDHNVQPLRVEVVETKRGGNGHDASQ